MVDTIGYLALKCATKGRTSEESYVYSFGVVSLEIAYGRNPIEPQIEPIKKNINVEWVWDLYRRGQLLEAIDKRLSTEFDEDQIECLMVVGL